MSICGSTRASAYFDFARAVSFDPTVLKLVAIRPYIVTFKLPHGVHAHSEIKQSDLSGTLSTCLSVCASVSQSTKSMNHDF